MSRYKYFEFSTHTYSVLQEQFDNVEAIQQYIEININPEHKLSFLRALFLQQVNHEFLKKISESAFEKQITGALEVYQKVTEKYFPTLKGKMQQNELTRRNELIMQNGLMRKIEQQKPNESRIEAQWYYEQCLANVETPMDIEGELENLCNETSFFSDRKC